MKTIIYVILFLSIPALSQFRGFSKNANYTSEPIQEQEYIYQDESLALFARMEVQPDETRKLLIDATIIALKNRGENGAWSKGSAIQVYAAHTQQAAILDWKNASRTATLIATPTFTEDRGFAGNAVDMSINTNYNAAEDVNIDLDNFSVGVYRRTANDNDANRWMFGAEDDNAAIEATRKLVGFLDFYTCLDWDQTNIIAGLPYVGFTFLSRLSTSSFVRYKGDKTSDTITAESLDITNDNIHVLSNIYVEEPFGFSTDQIAIFYAGQGLSQAEVEAMFDIFEAYLDAIGAGVVE